MLKLTYLLVFLIGTSLISCEKKIAPPSTGTTTPPPVTKDTLSGKMYLFAGNGEAKDSGDGGPATKGAFYDPEGIAVDAAGNIYIADGEGCRVRKVDIHGIVSTYAGGGGIGFGGDGGLATSAALQYPVSLAFDNSGNLYISDQGNNRVRKVDKNGIITTYAGNGKATNTGNGEPATNAAIATNGLATDDTGNLYIAEFHVILKVNTQDIISTIAGGGQSDPGDDGPATQAYLDDALGVAVDHHGNIYIADYDANRIRMVNKQGIITTIAGDGAHYYSGDGGPAVNAELYNPADIKLDASGNLYIADATNFRIRVINTNGIISTYAGNGPQNFPGGGDGGPATSASITYCPGIGLDALGNLYIAESYNVNKVRIVYK